MTGNLVRGIVVFAIGMGSVVPLASSSTDSLPWPANRILSPSASSVPGLTSRIVEDESYLLAFNTGNTAALVAALNEVRTECGSVPTEYRIDCLGQGLRWASRRISAPDYRQANGILAQAGNQLRAIARRNSDPAKPDLSANTSDNKAWKAPRKYKAVKRDKLNKAVAEARSVIDNAVAKLLRAAESSAERRIHYTKIASALASTKSLLRSS